MSDVWNPVSYTIKKGRPSGFKFTIEIDGKTELVQFKDNLYRCKTAEHENAIEDLMSKAQFTQNIQKVDLAAGEAIARAHMAGQRSSAVQGGMTSEIAKGLENKIAADDIQAISDATDALEKDNLVITEKVDQPIIEGVSISPATQGINLNVGNK